MDRRMCRRAISFGLFSFLFVLFSGAGLVAAPETVDLALHEEHLTVYGADPGDQLATGGFLSGSASGDGVVSGDLDGDGIPDLIVASPGSDGANGDRENAGQVSIFFGPVSPGAIDLSLTAPDAVIHGATAGESLGTSVRAADLSGDGIDDLILGGSGADGPGGRENAGTLAIVFGPVSAGTVRDLAAQPADVRIWGRDAGDQLGWSTAVGDVSGDEVSDLAVGVPLGAGPDETRIDGGEAYVLFGPFASGTVLDLAVTLPDVVVYGAEGRGASRNGGDLMGHRLTMGDLSMDGRPDLVLPAPGGDGPADVRTDAGQAHLLFGPFVPGTVVDLAVTSADALLYGVARTAYGAAVGDLNGDGIDDLLLGNEAGPCAPPAVGACGQVLAAYGPIEQGTQRDLTLGADLTLHGGDEGDHLGEYHVAVADLSGDGFDDVLVGSHWAEGPDDGRFHAGEVYGIYGPFGEGEVVDLATRAADLIVYGHREQGACTGVFLHFGDNLGYVLSAGDVSGDGIEDLLLGSADACGPADDRQQGGEAYVVLGGAVCPSCEDLLALLGETETRNAGIDRSLHAMAEAACAALERGRTDTAGNELCALCRHARALAGGALPEGAGRTLCGCAAGLRASLGLQASCF